MARDLFSKLVSVGYGLHKDDRSSNQYQQEFQKLNNEIKYKKPPIYKTEISNPIAIKEKYYFKLIAKESCKIYNEIIEGFHPQAEHPELHFTYTVFHNRLEQYLLDINNYIHSRNLNNNDPKIINFLKVNAIILFMELQDNFIKYSSKDYISIEQVYEYYFNVQLPEINEITKVCSTEDKTKILLKKERKSAKPKLSFGYKNVQTESLYIALKSLQFRIDLIDETHSTIKQFYELLTSKDFTKINYEIHIQCETTQFSYLVSKLKSFFTNLNPTTLERSKLFYTKTGTPLKASNLHKNKVYNPKEKEEIDKIIKQLQ